MSVDWKSEMLLQLEVNGKLFHLKIIMETLLIMMFMVLMREVILFGMRQMLLLFPIIKLGGKQNRGRFYIFQRVPGSRY